MNKEARRAELAEKVITLLWDRGPEAALPYAEELAALVERPTDWQSCQEWIAIWTARGRLDKAVELGEEDLERHLVSLNNFDPEVRDQPWFEREVRDILDLYYLQADRYLQLGIEGAARTKLQEAATLSTQYGVPFDNGLQQLYEQVNANLPGHE
jgi:hypothetical protein